MPDTQITLTFDEAYWQRLRELIREETARLHLLQQQQQLTDKRYSVDDVMRIFGVSRKTVLNWRKKGLLNGHVIDRKVFFMASDVEAATKKFGKYHIRIA